MIDNANQPVVRMFDEDGIVGIFSLETLKVVKNFDLDDCDILLFHDAMRLNKNSFIEDWNEITAYLTVDD